MKHLILISLVVVTLFVGCGDSGQSSSNDKSANSVPTSSSKSVSVINSDSTKSVYSISSYTKDSGSKVNKDAINMPQVPTASGTTPTAKLQESVD